MACGSLRVACSYPCGARCARFRDFGDDLLPGPFGVAGYVVSLVLITSGYALFQAANNTALMAATSKDQRGVTSALLALARNLGLITGASAMASLFALTSGGSSPSNAGLRATFAAASALALMALGLSIWGARRDS